MCEPVVGAILARDFGCSAAFPALPSRSAGPPDSAPVPKRGATRHFKEKARSVRRSSSRASRGKERVLAAEVLLALGIALVAVFAGLGFRILNLAWQALADLRDRLEEDQKARVTVSVDLGSLPLYHLRIANDGRRPARDLRLTISRGFDSFGDPEQNLARSAAFNQQISSFSPGAEIFFPLAETSTIFGSVADGMATPPRFWVTASYRDDDEIVEEATEIDLDAYRDAVHRPDPLASELKKLRESVAAIPEERSRRS